MPNHTQAMKRLAEVFQALADPTRLAVVERLSVGPVSTTELARPFDMALPSFIQHLGVLERAGVITSTKTGRVRVYQLVPGALGPTADWLVEHRSHWERRLDQLDALLIAANPPAAKPPAPRPPAPRPPAPRPQSQEPS